MRAHARVSRIRRACLVAAVTLLMLVLAAAIDLHVRPTANLVFLLESDRASPVARYLASSLARDGGKLSVTHFEYWTVPSACWRWAALALRALGSNASRLPDDWNHLLKRQDAQDRSEHRDALIKQMRGSPEFVSADFMKAQQAAVAEYALTLVDRL
jgi:hypothetical protein